MCGHHKTVLRQNFVDTPAQQGVKKPNRAFGQVMVKTAQEFSLSVGLIWQQSQRVRSVDLTALLSQYGIFQILIKDRERVFSVLPRSLPVH